MPLRGSMFGGLHRKINHYNHVSYAIDVFCISHISHRSKEIPSRNLRYSHTADVLNRDL